MTKGSIHQEDIIQNVYTPHNNLNLLEAKIDRAKGKIHKPTIIQLTLEQ